MESSILVMVIAVAAVAVVAVMVINQGRSRRAEGEAANSDMLRMAEAITAGQHDLAGRLAAISEANAASQNQLTKTLNDRLDAVSKRLGESLDASSEKTGKTMIDLRERLAKIDVAQKNITELSSQVVSLQDVLSNKQARGAFGEIQLNDLVVNALPPSAYSFQATLGNNSRADCLLTLPNPPGAIVIDAKFPLESYQALRNAREDGEKTMAARGFKADMIKHISDIAGKYIIPGETAESALLFLPSEAVYAELHANFTDVVERSHKARVWIVSPTTLMAVLNTIRAVLKDANMREQAGVIQKEVLTLIEDVDRLDNRVASLQKHFSQADKDIDLIKTSTQKITRRAERIEEIQLEELDSPAAELEDPALNQEPI